jgi:cysteine desulfurase
VAVSAGSACASADNRPSATLRALGLTAAQAQGSIRFGLGRFTTRADIETALTVLCAKLAGGDAELSKP